VGKLKLGSVLYNCFLLFGDCCNACPIFTVFDFSNNWCQDATKFCLVPLDLRIEIDRLALNYCFGTANVDFGGLLMIMN